MYFENIKGFFLGLQEECLGKSSEIINYHKDICVASLTLHTHWSTEIYVQEF